MIDPDAVLPGVFAILGYVVAEVLGALRARKQRAHERTVAALDRTYEQRRDACVTYLTELNHARRTIDQLWHEGERPVNIHAVVAPVHAAQVRLDVYTSTAVAEAGRTLTLSLIRFAESYGKRHDFERLNEYNDAHGVFIQRVRRELGAQRDDGES